MFQFIRVVTVGKRDERREEYNQIIKSYIFSPQSSASVGLQLELHITMGGQWRVVQGVGVGGGGGGARQKCR